jgi:hypothetical protein
MKKLNLYLLAFITAVIMLTSCSKNGTVTPQGATGQPAPTGSTGTSGGTGTTGGTDPSTLVNYTLSNSTGISAFQATFTLNGVSTQYNFPSTGSTTVPVPPGTYTIVSINPVGSAMHKFTMGARTPVVAHYATFSTVIVSTGSSDLSLSIQ